jgi:chaperonin GroES
MIIPAQDYILLTVEKKEEVSKGGIILPDKTSDTPQCGTVALDKDHWTKHEDGTQVVESWAKGIKVWFKRWAGEPINYNGKEYLLIHLKDIVAFEETR